MSRKVLTGPTPSKHVSHSPSLEPPRCTTCGRVMRWRPTAGHTAGGYACPVASHPRTDTHSHQLRLPIIHEALIAYRRRLEQLDDDRRLYAYQAEDQLRELAEVSA